MRRTFQTHPHLLLEVNTSTIELLYQLAPNKKRKPQFFRNALIELLQELELEP